MKKGLSRGGLTDRKICVAVTLGIFVGALISLWQFKSTPGGSSLSSRSQGEEKRLGTESVELRQQLETLQAQKDELTKVLEQVSREKDDAIAKAAEAEKQRSKGAENGKTEGVERPKAGPYGTVKASRTNPLLIPDRSSNPELADILEKVAIRNELVVGLSNIYIKDMLEVWIANIKRVGIKNMLVIALDDEVKRFCEANDVPVYRKSAKLNDDGTEASDNHGISGTKFNLLRDFLVLGYSVLLSDIDIVFLQNPFEGAFLHRDCDVEGMSDGFDNNTAYGYNDVMDDPSMGWARYAHTMRVFVMNSGLFYIRPTVPSVELLDRVRARLTVDKKAWDQAVFNEEMFFPSRPGYSGLHISKRILDYYNFMNSKVLFKEVRKDQRFANHLPVTIHVNYHPDKFPRMLAIVERYVKGNVYALQQFPDGSE